MKWNKLERQEEQKNRKEKEENKFKSKVKMKERKKKVWELNENKWKKNYTNKIRF